jgi:hypothetical protein
MRPTESAIVYTEKCTDPGPGLRRNLVAFQYLYLRCDPLEIKMLALHANFISLSRPPPSPTPSTTRSNISNILPMHLIFLLLPYDWYPLMRSHMCQRANPNNQFMRIVINMNVNPSSPQPHREISLPFLQAECLLFRVTTIIGKSALIRISNVQLRVVD